MAVLRRLLFLLFFPCVLLAQGPGVRYDNFVLKPLPAGGVAAVSGALITVCTSAGSGQPCVPKVANIYSDEALTVAISGTGGAGTTNSDSFGNYGFYIAPGSYVLTITGTGITSSTVKITVPCGPGSSCSTLSVGTLNNTCYADQQTGADMGIKIAACITALPSTGGVVDARGFQGAQTWSTNIFSGVTKPVLLLIGPCTFSVNISQSPATPNIRILGLGGPGGNGGGTGTGNTTLSVNFASGDVFTPTASGASFELGNMNVIAGVTRTSGYVVNPAPGANMGYIHDLHIQNQYGTFKLFSGGGVALNNWRLRNITWNCGSASVHTGEFLSLGSTDNTVTSSAHIFENFSSSGDICIHDTSAIHVGSNTDSPAFTDWNFSISRNNTSTQPNWLFDNTLGGGISPRLVSLVNIYTEGDAQAGNDILKISACTDCTFSNGDFGGGDHGINISGGSGLVFMGGQINNNQNGGLYVTSAVAAIGLTVQGVNFYGNSVTTNNTTDDIQIADGTSQVNISGNMFGQISSTVTANVTRWPINVLGTTSSQISIHGNESKSSKYGNTGLVRDVTVYSGETEMDDGRTLIKRGAAGSSRIWLLTDATHLNWQLGCQEITSAACGIAPSTANGVTTFTRDVLTIGSTGIVTVNGSSTPALAITNAANTGTTNLQGFTGAGTQTGFPATVLCNTSQKSESAADANVLTCTPVAIAGRYRISFSMQVSAQNTATLGWTATWTDSNGSAQAPTNLSLFTSGTAAPALTVTAATNGNYYGDAYIDINNAATNIVIKLTFAGTSFTAKASATVERVI